MKPLDSNFIGKGETKGYEFNLLGMTDRAFIYQRTGCGVRHYEVFKKMENRRFACISYPTSNAFGIGPGPSVISELRSKSITSCQVFSYD